ncbi:transposase [Clostridium tyrobutyricum]|jgi:putative transposase|nr:transposase [Clostridium tyrobutyricum]MBV4444957.1 transposase [Clostridium tyrobutyricum]MBV4448006.1 transposase [Clostridium tyrobutyricum]QCH29524.1 Transposase IS200 like protein [Clostridium tyrobutyricum]
MDKNSLAHTKWRCKYHVVFAPKYRRKEIYGERRKEIGKILRELCNWKGVEILVKEDQASEQLAFDMDDPFKGN